MGTVGRRVFRNYYKGHMDKTKEGRVEAREGGGFGWGGPVVMGRKGRQLKLNNNKVIKNK